ncbi:MAG: S8/S53 family peptidase [Alphaproteobacteria bacterium]|nr:S8/S53 family peptidase [Alphaproteobacteria bacterium]
MNAQPSSRRASRKADPSKGEPPKRMLPRGRNPLPNVRFSIRLKPKQKLADVRKCIEIHLGTKLADFFPDLLRYKDSIWKYDPRRGRNRLREHLVDDATFDKRKRDLAAGKLVGLPFRLEEPSPAIGKIRLPITGELLDQKFVILTLPIQRREFRQKNCCAAGKLYDFSHALKKACDVASVTPALEHPVTLQVAAFSALFPSRAAPPQASVPSAATWHLANIRANTVPAGTTGAGVVVGHTDTGWTAHPELNFAGGASPNYTAGFEACVWPVPGPSALEPVPGIGIPGLTNRFHGTRTASMIVSVNEGTVAGLAPGATIFPVRCTPDVVLLPPGLDDVVLAEAILVAVARGAQVISISLGGYTTEILRWAIQVAVFANVIVVAAAGNYWPLVVYPAAYPECIAVGGSTADDLSWAYSARNFLGPDIDISAPSEFVVNATWAGTTSTTQANDGTSFGTALVAGAAALWLQTFGRTTLITALGGRAPLQELFRAHLVATARVPSGWNSALDGPGILDLSGLLSAASLPNPTTFPIPAWLIAFFNSLAAGANLLMNDLFGQNLSGGVPRWADALFADAEGAMTEFGAEVMQLIMSNPLAADMIQSLDGAARAADEAAANAEEAAEEIADQARLAAEQAAQTAGEVADAVVDAVSDGASNAVSTVAGWFS